MRRSLFYSCLCFLLSCTKQHQPPPSRDPIPGTVEKRDTLRVMAYNVLNYGDQCQGSTAYLNNFLREIIRFTRPDLLGCEKVTAFPLQRGSSGNLADGILSAVFDSLSPGKYDYAPPTNASGGGTVSLLFYNREKLGFLHVQNILSLVTDFDLYSFYYKDVNLAVTHDSTFLYVLLCHTKSVSASLERDFQDSAVMASLRKTFHPLPNLLVMGDFNARGSYEAGYQSILGKADSAERMYDPPYEPDHELNYPGNWSVSPSFAARFLTTSTRGLSYSPNSCGASGGGKGWYDHIFCSHWLITGSDYARYVPGSYGSVGNDGFRVGVSVNDSLPVPNSSVPDAVANAIFHFSDKYPVMLEIEMTANRSGNSLPDPGNH